MEPQTTSKKIITPAKLLKYLSWTALGWGVIGFLGIMLTEILALGGMDSLGYLVMYAFLGAAILIISSILALISAIRAFSSGDKVSGYKFLALIIALPAIGLGIGCGTFYVGSSVLGVGLI